MPTVGLISDTHGLLRREALAYLRGHDYIVHAGDVGDPSVLSELATLAPVFAVRGNNDAGAWARALPEHDVLDVDGVRIFVLHDLAELDVHAPPGGTRVVVSGHSHRPAIAERDGLLYVNPGSAGPRRFKLPIAAATLRVERGAVTAQWVDLLTIAAT